MNYRLLPYEGWLIVGTALLVLVALIVMALWVSKYAMTVKKNGDTENESARDENSKNIRGSAPKDFG